MIQNEIARCQLQYVQQKRIQEEILQSFSVSTTVNTANLSHVHANIFLLDFIPPKQLDGIVLKQPNLNEQQFSSNQPGVAMTANGNRKYNQYPSSADLTPATNTCGYASKENNER